MRRNRVQNTAVHKQEIRRLFRKGLSKHEIAKRLMISRTSLRRLLGNP
jgi:DNA invertase Pin-like site-specific DNA recombinase